MPLFAGELRETEARWHETRRRFWATKSFCLFVVVVVFFFFFKGTLP